jgi:hypothetical protein
VILANTWGGYKPRGQRASRSLPFVIFLILIRKVDLCWSCRDAIGPTFWVVVQFESEAVDDGETIAGMDVWLQTEELPKESLSGFVLSAVPSKQRR